MLGKHWVFVKTIEEKTKAGDRMEKHGDQLDRNSNRLHPVTTPASSDSWLYRLA